MRQPSKIHHGLWRKEGINGGKFLVLRRDGTVPEWPYFVLGAKDPAAGVALQAYANECKRLDMDVRYVCDLYDLAGEFDDFRAEHGNGDPDGRPHRRDNPETVAMMEEKLGA